MNKRSSLLGVCLLLNACTGNPPSVDNGLAPPPAWQYAERDATQATNQRWWTQFGSPPLNRLIDQARRDSYDVAAAMARVRQAQASAVIAGAPLLPEVKFNLTASREKLLRGSGNASLDATDSNKTVDSFGANLTASYELDFWGGRFAARDSALQSLRASEFDQATVELTLRCSGFAPGPAHCAHWPGSARRSAGVAARRGFARSGRRRC